MPVPNAIRFRATRRAPAWLAVACTALAAVSCYDSQASLDYGTGHPIGTPHAAPPDSPARAGNRGEPRQAAGEPPPEPDAAPAGGSDLPLAPISVQPEPDLRVAFIGDQGLGNEAWEVLQLILRERAAMVVHAGDMSYGLTDPVGWEAEINDALGPDFPYLVAIGNHDLDDWLGPSGFSEVLKARLARTPGLGCYGELGVQSLCRYRGLEVVLSGVGVMGEDNAWYLERTLARPGAVARLCVWHKNQHDMQVGAKVDEVGWAAYQICQHYGAPIITGHEHSYSRTFTLTALGDRERAHGKTGVPEIVTLGTGKTFVAVSGLGGRSTRTRTLDHVDDTWWASIYANDYQLQNGMETGDVPTVLPGALFIDFHVDGDPRKARAYFKTIDAQVVDQFELRFEARE